MCNYLLIQVMITDLNYYYKYQVLIPLLKKQNVFDQIRLTLKQNLNKQIINTIVRLGKNSFKSVIDQNIRRAVLTKIGQVFSTEQNIHWKIYVHLIDSDFTCLQNDDQQQQQNTHKSDINIIILKINTCKLSSLQINEKHRKKEKEIY
ncbi:unnamed protein product [Paramecium sonneborni]|uniref:Uncharacterized protein n=1 Tax=Paramecium sonneborni TaxID=65129 RepID=A0A8S1PUH6_9CILI|nr:unnamed protein product [Paramecium sonneborni]